MSAFVVRIYFAARRAFSACACSMWERTSFTHAGGQADAVTVRHAFHAATACSSRAVPLSRSPSLQSAVPRLFCVIAQSSGTRSRVRVSGARQLYSRAVAPVVALQAQGQGFEARRLNPKGPFTAHPRRCRTPRRRSLRNPICRPSSRCIADRNLRYSELLRTSWIEARVTKGPRRASRCVTRFPGWARIFKTITSPACPAK